MKIRLDKSKLNDGSAVPAANDPEFQDTVEVPELDQLDESFGQEYSEESFWDKCKDYAASIGRDGLESALVLYYAPKNAYTPIHLVLRYSSKNLHIQASIQNVF